MGSGAADMGAAGLSANTGEVAKSAVVVGRSLSKRLRVMVVTDESSRRAKNEGFRSFVL